MAALYAVLGCFALRLLLAAEPAASCGCFGADAPPVAAACRVRRRRRRRRHSRPRSTRRPACPSWPRAPRRRRRPRGRLLRGRLRSDARARPAAARPPRPTARAGAPRDRPARLGRLAAARAADVAAAASWCGWRSAARPLAVAPLRYLLRPRQRRGGDHLPRLRARGALLRRLDRVLLHHQRRRQHLPPLHVHRRLVEVHELHAARSCATPRACATTSTATACRRSAARTAARAPRDRARTARPAATCSATASATPRCRKVTEVVCRMITCENPCRLCSRASARCTTFVDERTCGHEAAVPGERRCRRRLHRAAAAAAAGRRGDRARRRRDAAAGAARRCSWAGCCAATPRSCAGWRAAAAGRPQRPARDLALAEPRDDVAARPTSPAVRSRATPCTSA